jgi:hypothetical protein
MSLHPSNNAANYTETTTVPRAISFFRRMTACEKEQADSLAETILALTAISDDDALLTTPQI